jgi:hypothetical protein
MPQVGCMGSIFERAAPVAEARSVLLEICVAANSSSGHQLQRVQNHKSVRAGVSERDFCFETLQ